MMVWLRRMAFGVGAIALLGAIVWLAVPALIKWQVPLRASEALGRSVTLGDVGFKPWSLEMTVNDLAIAGLPEGRSEPLLRVRRIRADLSIKSLFERAPVVESLEIDTPVLSLTRTRDGHYDIDDLIARFTPGADAPRADPARFALYNLQVRDAQLRFDDRPAQRIHVVEALRLALPFLSNLPAEVDVKVEPRLAFKLNGTPFDSGAQATPFARDKNGALNLKMADLDLAPYLGYLPAAMPVRVTRGSLSTDLALQFAVPQNGVPTVILKGNLGAKDVALTDAAGQPLLAWQRLQLALRDVQPLARKLEFETLRVDALQLHASRDASGRVNLLQIGDAQGAVSAGVKANAATDPIIEATPQPQPPASPVALAWQLGLAALELTDARVLWKDAGVTPSVGLQIDGLGLSVKRLHWPIAAPMAVALSGALRAQGSGVAPALAEFAVDGPVTDRDAKLAVTFSGLSLSAFAPYLAQVLVPEVEGRLAAKAQLDWSSAADAPRLRLAIDSATLDAFSLREGRGRAAQDVLSVKQLVLGDTQVDVLARDVVLGSVKVVQPAVSVTRAADGRLNLQQWMVASPRPAAATRSRLAGRKSPITRAAPAAPALSSEPTWHVQLKDVLVDAGSIRVADATAHPAAARRAEPLRFELANLRVAAQGLAWQGERAMAPANVQLSARIGAPKRDKSAHTGVLDYKGRVGLLPLLANGKLKVERFPVHLFAPYFADRVKLTLLRADAGYTGTLALRQLPAGLDVNASGDILLTDVHVAPLADSAAPASAENTGELLSWQALALKATRITLKPGVRPQVEVGEIALNDFYSRLVITEQGRFNLQDVAAAPAGAASAASGGADNASPPNAASASASAAAPASAPAVVAADSGLPLDLRLGITKLTNGRIDFTDRFVRPGYSAALTELNGQLGAFSSGSREMATLDLRGRAAGTALLEISGQLNPTVKPLALDIRAKATDLELAPLSPYAGKYAGYAIERGKLSMEVAYKIDADGKLDAKNQVVLNQLTFGDKIESKDATKLPVLLAVALLKDRNGVIDINLPVSGSINDPKFSVGGIIIKVIINLLTKAFTAPFALLAGGGSDDLSAVDFQAGTALVTANGTSAIDKVAKALTDKPSLKMTVTGAADPVSEREAFQQAALDARLLAEKRREALRSDAPADAASAPESLRSDERAQLLKQVYKATDLPNKPRNAIGFAKDISGPEMEALLKARTPVSEDAMRELALQRGIVVRDALMARGLPSARLFLAAPKLHAGGDGAGAWTPQVRLALSMN